MEGLITILKEQSLMTMFSIIILGYLLGSIKIRGLSLGASGVLLVALVYGHFGLVVPSIIRNLGLVCFVTSVGFIAGPRFFENFKSNAASFIMLGVLTVTVGAIICVCIICIAGLPCDLALGMMAGALTSTPGLAAAMESTKSQIASVGYGIAYPFGVVGGVLFVQLLPRLLHVDIDAECARLDIKVHKEKGKEYRSLDSLGLLPFAVAVVLGIILGNIRIPLPGGSFALGTSGGPLLAGLFLAHISHIGSISTTVPKDTLEILRQLGLVLFLMGAGTDAGGGFVEILMEYGAVLFILGALITTIPMVIGYIVARKIFHIDVLDTLGAICGGRTSTPALGTLMEMTHCESVALAYASTYPVALIMMVLYCQFIPVLLEG